MTYSDPNRKIKFAERVAEQIHGVFFGGNWTDSNFKDQLESVTLNQAFAKKGEHNTIAELAYHIVYFVKVQLRVLEGGPLQGSDAESFDVPAFKIEEEWRSFLDEALAAAKRHADSVAELDDEILFEPFVDEKFGTWWDNLEGLVEHTHYHLGQISLLRKLYREK